MVHFKVYPALNLHGNNEPGILLDSFSSNLIRIDEESRNFLLSADALTAKSVKRLKVVGITPSDLGIKCKYPDYKDICETAVVKHGLKYIPPIGEIGRASC